MVQTIDDLIRKSKAMGYRDLAIFLEHAKPQLSVRCVKGIKAGDNPCEDGDMLNFMVRKGSESHRENRLYFADSTKMYKAAYQMLDVMRASELEWYEKVIDTNLKFNDITLKQPDLLTMIKYFNQLMKNPVIIYDEFFNITVITDQRLSDYEADEINRKRYEMQNLYYFKQNVRFKNPDAPVKNCSRLLYPVLLEGMPKGYLAIFDTETPYGEMDMMILEIFANSILTEMRRQLELSEVESKYVSDFIYDLLYRKEAKEEEIQRRAVRLHVLPDAKYCFIAINPVGTTDDLFFYTNGHITQYEFMNDRIMSNIENFNKKTYKQDIVTKFNTTVYILHKIGQNQETESYEDIKNYCRKLLKMLMELFDGMHFQIGIGDIVDGLINVSGSFHQAGATISYGELIHGEKESFVACYADNSLLKLFTRLNEIGGLEEMIPSNLQELWNYDQKNHTQFYETLKVYLNCNCNAKRAAEQLFVHYKTMLYRIEKLRNTFHIDLEDANSRLFLELGIQLLDMQKK